MRLCKASSQHPARDEDESAAYFAVLYGGETINIVHIAGSESQNNLCNESLSVQSSFWLYLTSRKVTKP